MKLPAHTPSFDLPGGASPAAIMAEGLRPPATETRAEWPALSLEEVASMLPAFELRRMVNHGGMGTVYEAVQRDLQRRVAIKLLSPALTDQPGLAARFRHEARLMAGIDHPGIVQVFEAGETAEGHLYYVMEFVDGEDLATRMRRERLPVDEAVPLVSLVADALHAAHRLGVVHRDVKPGNILLAPQKPPRLGDFGLALSAEQASDPLRLTRPGTTVGTLEYAAPEQLSHQRAVTQASDVYSLGVLTYELLTGELPRGSFDPPSLRNPAVDPAFDGVVLRALQSDPARRFADAGAFREALLHAADRRRQQTLRDQALRRKIARRARLSVALAAVAVLTGGSAMVAWYARRESEERRIAAESAEQRMAGLFQFLLTDLRRRLEPTGNLGAMEAVLEKAVAHFRSEFEKSGRSPDAAMTLADVLVVKADVIGVRGLESEADALYSEAIALTHQASEAAPRDAERAFRALHAIQDRTEHRQAAARYREALADARLMLQQAEAVSQKHPGPRATHAVAAAHRAIAHALGYTGPLEGARDEYLRAHALLQALSSAEPENRRYTDELADLDMSLGSNAEARGDLQDMLRRFTSWHDSIQRRYGTDSAMYSHAAFRMGVALQKLGRPSEAIPYLTNALRIAERDAAAEPGHKGHLNHVSWCLRYLAEAYEALGNSAEAAPLRAREAEVNALLAAVPEAVTSTLEPDFDRLAADPATNRKAWWAFCQSVERAAEALPDGTAAQQFYEKWVARTSAAAPAGDSGNFIHLVSAFLHNRVAGLWLEKDPVRSGQHAQQALALRAAVAAAHPEEPELHRDVLSSACHAATAAVRGEDAAAAQTALEKVAACAASLPESALTIEDNGLFFANRSAVLLEYAASRWPDRLDSFRKTGSAISAALLDRLPQDASQQTAAKTLRARLTQIDGASEK